MQCAKMEKLVIGTLPVLFAGAVLVWVTAFQSDEALAAGGPPPRKFKQAAIGTCTEPFADEKLRVCFGSGAPLTGPGLGTAIFGEATNNIAIMGSGDNGNGVLGISNNVAGTVGTSINATGVVAISRRTDGGSILRADFENPQGTFNTRFEVDTAGNATAFAHTVFSSRTIKENVAPIDDALEKIARLEGVYFKYKKEYGGKAALGFIAEDVARVLPELVTWTPDGQTAQALSYAPIVAVAIEGVKQQQRQIKKLEAENASLEEKLAELQAQMADLSSKMARLARTKE